MKPFFVNLLVAWAGFLTIICLFTPIDIGNLVFLPGLILMWLLYGAFYFGFTINNRRIDGLTNNTLKIDNNSKSKKSIFWAIASLIFYPVYIKFYTGIGIQEVFLNVLNNDSNYQIYQRYFSENKLAEFTIQKLPFVFLHGFFKFIFISTVCRVVGFERKVYKGDIFLICSMGFNIILFSVARGTSFELFEIIMIFLFAFLVRRKVLSNRDWFRGSTLLFIGATGIIFILLFSINIALRGGGNIGNSQPGNITNELRYDPKTLIAVYFPALSVIIFQLSGYFSFGIFFTSVSLTSVHFSSFRGFVAMLIPNGLTALGFGRDYNDVLCGNLIDCGVAWIPDVNMYLGYFGIFALIILIICLGYISKNLFARIFSKSIPVVVLLYFCVLSMISLPMGNLILHSSANILSIMFALIFLYFPSLNKILYK